jgi:hypothetical protein
MQERANFTMFQLSIWPQQIHRFPCSCWHKPCFRWRCNVQWTPLNFAVQRLWLHPSTAAMVMNNIWTPICMIPCTSYDQISLNFHKKKSANDFGAEDYLRHALKHLVAFNVVSCKGSHFHFFPPNRTGKKKKVQLIHLEIKFIIYLNISKVSKIHYENIYT